MVAVWGAAYVERFARFGLASMMAPGNLPAVAERWDVEFVILTRRENFQDFQVLELMASVMAKARVRYEAIDDLLSPGLFTVTLTLAYMRGVRLAGEAMTRTHFIFWNADFVLSDGAFSYLADEMDRGGVAILAGSLRAVSEAVADGLTARVGVDGALSLSGRAMTRLTLDHPHRMQTAKTVNQPGVWARAPNHMFWTVGEDAVVARFWQIFMLCLRPTRPLGAIDGYCDYSFVPALCPNAPFTVVDDSDKVCLLELQSAGADHEAVCEGPGRDAAWRASIDEWCTLDHLAVARRPILFHAGEAPAEAEATVTASARFVEAMVEGRETRPAHEGHYYWAAGVAAWNRGRADPSAPPPPELDDRLALSALRHPTTRYALRDGSRAAQGGERGLGRVKTAVLGAGERPGARHPDAAALRFLGEALRRVRARRRGGAWLMIADPLPWLDRLFPPDEDGCHRMTTAMADIWRVQADVAMEEAVVYLRAGRPGDVEKAVGAAVAGLGGGGRLTVLAHAPAYDREDGGFLEAVTRAFDEHGLSGARQTAAWASPEALAYADRLKREGLRALSAGGRFDPAAAFVAAGLIARGPGRASGEPGRPVAVALEAEL